MNVEFVEYTLDFLELSWNWLNDPDIKKLTHTPDFTKEDQKNWFENLEKTNSYKVWGVTANHTPIGVAGLKKISKTNADVFWYIGDSSFWGKGVGSEIASTISQKALLLGLKDIYADSLVENFKSINLLFKDGYRIIGLDGGIYRLKKTLMYD
jgi:RimJ/RimL family protein N-acetyltransferase